MTLRASLMSRRRARVDTWLSMLHGDVSRVHDGNRPDLRDMR